MNPRRHLLALAAALSLALAGLSACASSHFDLERTQTERAIPNGLAIWASWVEVKPSQLSARLHVENQAVGAVAVPVNTLTCDKGEVPGRLTVSEEIPAGGNIFVYPFDTVEFTLTCQVNTQGPGPFRVVMPQVFEGDARAENGLGAPIASYFFWRIPEHLLE